MQYKPNVHLKQVKQHRHCTYNVMQARSCSHCCSGTAI